MAVAATLKVVECAQFKGIACLLPLVRLVKVSKSPGLLSVVCDLAVSAIFSSSFWVEGVEGNDINCGGGGVASGDEAPLACNCPMCTTLPILINPHQFLINAQQIR